MYLGVPGKKEFSGVHYTWGEQTKLEQSNLLLVIVYLLKGDTALQAC